jgi:hypothetical protein
MAQQPNVEIAEASEPQTMLEPGPAVKWRASKPGIPSRPADVPSGGRFGSAGPDPGWAVKVVDQAGLPSDDPALRSIVIGLVQARAAAHGRAAVPEDVDAALVLCGYGEDVSPALVERRERWMLATSHDQRPGASAVAEVDRDLIAAKPEQIRYALRLSEKG